MLETNLTPSQAHASKPRPSASTISYEALNEIQNRPFNKLFNLPSIEEARAQYLAAKPFPHLQFKNFFADDVFAAIKSSLVEDDLNVSFQDEYQKGKTISTGAHVPPVLQVIAARFASAEFLEFMEAVTGEKCLIPDPYYNTLVGYYHIVKGGGILGSHVDHSHHVKLGSPHVLNVVSYLTPNWDEKNGGSLFLYDPTGKKIEKKIPCVGNSMVIFACNPTAFHGVEPVVDNGPRRHSIYFAYYSTDPETTLRNYLPNLSPEDATAKWHGTTFVIPFWKLFQRQNRSHLKYRVLGAAREVFPPILFRVLRKGVRMMKGSS